ncbi:MAG: EAL domain-containing protein [Gammaproteobacteria bacterium]|nr:EAL domain-containing protein [Gammaproteobacteria bacterium]
MESTVATIPSAFVIPAFWVSAGIILYTGVQSAVVGIVGQRVPLYLAFAFTCLCAAGYQYSMAIYYHTPSVWVAADALRMQSMYVLLFHPAFFVFVGLYTKQARLPPWIILVVIAVGVLLLENYSAPYSVRYNGLIADGTIRLPWGEVLSRFRGEVAIGNMEVRILNWAVFGWAIGRAFVQFRSGSRRAAVLLSICLVLMLIAGIEGLLIDNGIINFFYTSGFAFLGFAALMSVGMGMELHHSTVRLNKATTTLQIEVAQRQRIEAALRHLVEGMSRQTGELFFREVVTELARMFNADYAFIGTVDTASSHYVTTLALYRQGVVTKNIQYSLTHSPCAGVVGQTTCVYLHSVSDRFPQDELLKEWAIESYIGTPLFDANNQPLGLIVIMAMRPLQDIELMVDMMGIVAARAAAEIQRLQAEQKIQRMAYEDYLTQLPNRAALHLHLSEVLSQSQAGECQGALLLLDLDHFKTINDALSHEVGDAVLREVGRRLRAIISAQAFAARMGGDEFVVVLQVAAVTQTAVGDSALALAKTILNELSNPLLMGDRLLNIGVSIGIVEFPDADATELDILRRADMALYRAKKAGRGTVEFYKPSMQTAIKERLHLERGIHEAQQNGNFRLAFQPQVTSTGKVIGVEALLRWRDPELGDISPALFIPVAEETGAIHAIGGWVLQQACEALSRWRAQTDSFTGHIAINVSPWQFARSDFVEQTAKAMHRHGMDTRRLILEITESALLYDVKETIDKLHQLREMGLRIALDDFGTGYSALSYLKSLPLDILKIDESFVAELSSQRGHPLVATIVAIGKHMDLQVIAEGVETVTQRDQLHAIGCEYYQGFYFSPPLFEADLLNLLATASMNILNNRTPAVADLEDGPPTVRVL